MKGSKNPALEKKPSINTNIVKPDPVKKPPEATGLKKTNSIASTVASNASKPPVTKQPPITPPSVKGPAVKPTVAGTAKTPVQSSAQKLPASKQPASGGTTPKDIPKAKGTTPLGPKGKTPIGSAAKVGSNTSI